MCNRAAGTSGIFEPTVGVLTRALLLQLKGLAGIIRSLPLCRPSSEARTGPARLHWSRLVFRPWFNASCSRPLLIYFTGPGAGSVASRTVISLPATEQKSDSRKWLLREARSQGSAWAEWKVYPPCTSKSSLGKHRVMELTPLHQQDLNHTISMWSETVQAT